jgi:hypothetical protein
LALINWEYWVFGFGKKRKLEEMNALFDKAQLAVEKYLGTAYKAKFDQPSASFLATEISNYLFSGYASHPGDPEYEAAGFTGKEVQNFSHQLMTM